MCQNGFAGKNRLNNVFDTMRQRGYRQYRNKVKSVIENNFVGANHISPLLRATLIFDLSL
jgi:hypothetical protein